jgi:hypothetical protein
VACGAALLAAAWAGIARADDVAIDAETVLQAYEVRSPGTTAFVARRRLLQSVGFTWSRALATRPDADGRTPRVGASARLRLTQELGDTCLVARDLCVRATNARDAAAYEPLARDTWVDVPTAFVEVDGLPIGLSVRAGRQLAWDVIGFVRLDGGRARLEPAPWLALEALGGLLVRDTTIGGSAAFELPGGPRFALPDDRARTQAPWIEEPPLSPVMHGALEVGVTEIVRGRLTYRQAWSEEGALYRRAALSLASTPLRALRLDAHGVLDALDGAVIAAMAGARVEASERATVAARVERNVPRFDPGTIWAYFSVAPVDEAQLDLTYRAGGDADLGATELGGALRARRADLGPGLPTDVDVGGEVRARARLPRLSLGGTAFLWSGSLGPMAGVLADARLRLLSDLDLEARLSVWHFEDDNRPALHGTIVSEVVGLRWQVGRETRLLVELEHAQSRVTGHRLRAVVALDVEVWR